MLYSLQVTIIRRIGDQTHTVTRRKDNHGNEETQVDVANVDKGRLILAGLSCQLILCRGRQGECNISC